MNIRVKVKIGSLEYYRISLLKIENPVRSQISVNAIKRGERGEEWIFTDLIHIPISRLEQWKSYQEESTHCQTIGPKSQRIDE